MIDLDNPPTAYKARSVQFKEEVIKNRFAIDPQNSIRWADFIYGWLIAKGDPPEEAFPCTQYIRYGADLFGC